MARSHAIWLVTRQRTNAPIAAFTVKHELVTWLGRQPISSVPLLSIWYCLDGPEAIPGYPDTPPKLVTEEIKAKVVKNAQLPNSQ